MGRNGPPPEDRPVPYMKQRMQLAELRTLRCKYLRLMATWATDGDFSTNDEAYRGMVDDVEEMTRQIQRLERKVRG